MARTQYARSSTPAGHVALTRRWRASSRRMRHSRRSAPPSTSGCQATTPTRIWSRRCQQTSTKRTMHSRPSSRSCGMRRCSTTWPSSACRTLGARSRVTGRGPTTAGVSRTLGDSSPVGACETARARMARGGNHFVIGGGVAGGRIFGEYPADLTEVSAINIGRGRFIPTLPWEGVWNALAQWFGATNSDLDYIMPNRGNFATSQLLRANTLFPGARGRRLQPTTSDARMESLASA
eukprot:1551516-Prymnesium_polylepis.1